MRIETDVFVVQVLIKATQLILNIIFN